MKETENNNDKFLLCECMAEGILLTNNEEDKLVYINLFQHANTNNDKSLFLKRLRYAWKHIITGRKDHSHEIILSYDKAKELRKWLNDNTTEEAWKDNFKFN